MKEMKIEVLSQEKIEKYLTDLPHIVISIREPDSPGYKIQRAKLPNNPNRIAELYLDFCDMDATRYPNVINMPETYKLFSKEDAKSILSFVKLTEVYVNLIVINCSAGISRSAGVGAALSIILGLPDKDAKFFNPRGPFTPNRFVYRTLLDTWMEQNESN